MEHWQNRGLVMSFARNCGKIYREKLKQSGALRGYYLKIKDNFHYIASDIDVEALETVAARVLNDKTGYNYWIDYSHGLDNTGRIAWSNLDFTDKFF